MSLQPHWLVLQGVLQIHTIKGGGTTGARGAPAPLISRPYNTDYLLK